MTWAFAIFATFVALFAFVFSFFIYVYKKEYDREERIVQEVEKARLAASGKMSLVYLPIDQIEAIAEKSVVKEKQEVPEKGKKGLN